MTPTTVTIPLYLRLIKDEGQKLTVYQDHLDYWTIANGICVDARVPGAGLTPEECNMLTNMRIESIITQVNGTLPWMTNFAIKEPVRAGVLYEMAYQMGVHGLLEFNGTLSACRLEHYGTAADLMLQSKWAQQTPARAKQLSDIMRKP